LLLSKGAKVNVRSNLGRTPLLIAAAYDEATEAARLLIEKGVDVNARDKSAARSTTVRHTSSFSFDRIIGSDLEATLTIDRSDLFF
jgi:hypothetical protein